MIACRYFPTLILLTCGLFALLAGAALHPAFGDTPAQGSPGSYPYAGTSAFSITGKIVAVDGDRDLVTVLGDDGNTYTIDTLGSDIVLKAGDKSGNTEDLANDMRVRIKGSLLSGNLVTANELDVLPGANAAAPQPAPPPAAPTGIPPDKPPTPPADDAAQGQLLPISLRGTVVNVDSDTGSFEVHINDHQRTIYVVDGTTFPNIPAHNNDIPLHPGDRVTVDGKLAVDGSVTASVVRMVRPIRSLRELVGLVAETSRPLYRRDIEVKLDDGPVVTVRVPRGTAILDDGEPVSVHSLTTNDVVRVEGAFNGNDFSATRIDVLPPAGNAQ